MKVKVAIKSLEQNIYFKNKSDNIFEEVVYVENRPSEEEMPDFLSNTDVVIIGAREKISKIVLEKSKSLPKIIGTLSVGLDHIDIEEIEKRGIKVINAPTANVLSVAEHVIGFALALSKNLKLSHQAVINDEGRAGVIKKPFELFNKTIGIVGLGKIGSKVAEFAKCFGMNVISTTQSKTTGSDGEINFVELKKLFTDSDIISINVPLNNETANFINKELLEYSKPNLNLINTSRSEVVNHKDILQLLVDNKISGYAEDSDHVLKELAQHPNVICSPHLAGLTNEASDRLDNELIDNIEKYFNK
ncbi:D-isomer specific 2-hydroxyacid dehydrogenase family protein [Polaribacter sp. MSW13]|uniref:D-isomer specific 2-hydroxyacid dehydrogenase family protein n=1 Tax=Polaribacter marinus TaxID=2916838 RepID=A0A9X1VR66_9FLAO|nr:D-isomer specific 2-hydroxyacid dehydrogenase family protein [Polaribacter marinus]MCI2230333.1 D-isomer specific 2-hydroxyacid dehydrogenase family protein [Polaribacter marinus]